MARLTGLEPATPGVTGRYSNQLSYNRPLRARRALPAKRCMSLVGKIGGVKRQLGQNLINLAARPPAQARRSFGSSIHVPRR